MSQSISEEFIRDVTQVQPRPKSEVRSRLNEIISQALIAERKELREKVEMMKRNVKITRVGGFFNGDIPITIKDEEKENLVKQTLDAVLQLLEEK